MGRTKEEIAVDLIVSRFKEIRLEQGLSHETLAKKAGLHRTYIGLIEANKRKPSLLNCLKIASALDCNLSELIRETED